MGRKTVSHIKVAHLEICSTRPSKSHRFPQHSFFNLEIDSEMTKEIRILSYGIFIHYVLIDEYGLNRKSLCRVIRCMLFPPVLSSMVSPQKMLIVALFLNCEYTITLSKDIKMFCLVGIPLRPSEIIQLLCIITF